MTILAWTLLGVIAGFVTNKFVKRPSSELISGAERLRRDLIWGVVGANVGSFLFVRFNSSGVYSLNLYSILMAVIGAVVVLFIYRVLVVLVGRRAA